MERLLLHLHAPWATVIAIVAAAETEAGTVETEAEIVAETVVIAAATETEVQEEMMAPGQTLLEMRVKAEAAMRRAKSIPSSGHAARLE